MLFKLAATAALLAVAAPAIHHAQAEAAALARIGRDLAALASPQALAHPDADARLRAIEARARALAATSQPAPAASTTRFVTAYAAP